MMRLVNVSRSRRSVTTCQASESTMNPIAPHRLSAETTALTQKCPRNASRLVSYRLNPAVQNALMLWNTAVHTSSPVSPGAPASRKAKNSATAPAVSTTSVNSTTCSTNRSTRIPLGSTNADSVTPRRKSLSRFPPARITNDPAVMYPTPPSWISARITSSPKKL